MGKGESFVRGLGRDEEEEGRVLVEREGAERGDEREDELRRG